MTRLMLMTFLGQKRWLAGVHPHESPAVMTVPLIILGVFSFAGGLLLNNWIGGWLDPAFGIAHGEEHAAGLLNITGVGIATLLLVAAGVAVAFVFFGPRKEIPLTAPDSRSPFTLAGRNDLYGDALNEAALMRPGQQLTDGLLRLENDGIDGGGERDRRGDHPDLRPAPEGAERFRAVVRADHGPRGRGGRCCDRPRTARLERCVQ